jgi:succinoglycan biosynthesis transport protein ExoP
MRISQLLKIFWARRALLLGVMLAVTVGTLAYNLLKPPSYVAELSLLVDVKNNSEVLNGPQSAPQVDSGYLATQVDVISSHNVAVKVVDRLQLSEDPEWQAAFSSMGHADGTIKDWLADQLLDKLTVKPSRESSVINLTFTAPDPRMAADIANAFADAYIATNLELRMDPARHEAGWFDEQLLGLRKKWEAAQERLSKYQQENNVVGNDGRLDIENAQLTEISRQLGVAQASLYEAEARNQQVDKRATSADTPDALANANLQNIKTDLSRAETRVAEMQKYYGENHPQYQGAKAEVDSLRRKLDQEKTSFNGSLSQSVRIAKIRVQGLEQALANQRAGILALKQKYDALEVLTREVQGAQRTYDAASQRGSEVRLESQLNQSSIAILNPAVIPRKTPRSLAKKLLLAAVLGGLLGSALALAGELVDQRVRGEDDVVDGVGLIVLGEVHMREARLPWPVRQLPFLRGALGKSS